MGTPGQGPRAGAPRGPRLTDPTLVAVAAAERRAGDPYQAFTLGEVEAVRLMLRGGSVIDWRRIRFEDPEDVDRFLRVHEFDPAGEADRAYLGTLRDEALDYVEDVLGLRVVPEVAEATVAGLLWMASSAEGRAQVHACTMLKVLHVIHHLRGRELLTKLPVSDDQLFHLVEQKVLRAREELMAIGTPRVVEFAWSRKRREAQITKLLAKKETIAAGVYDKLRFRLVVETLHDIPPVLRYLARRVIPFNYIVPLQSENSLWPFRSIMQETPLARFSGALQFPVDAEDRDASPANEFSGPSYRVINFVADLPVRMDRFLCRSDDLYQRFGPVTFVMSEVQVMDARAAADSEQGDSSHERYKERQIQRVKARLLRGATGNNRDNGR